MSYQPDFFAEGNSIRKDCDRRLNLILDNFDKGTALDIGCSEGYNSFGMATKADHVMAIEQNTDNFKVCERLAAEHNIQGVEFHNIGLQEFLEQTSSNWDCILYLSVHHHVCGQVGFWDATEILRHIASLGKTMFFDMGQKNEVGCETYPWWKELPATGSLGQKNWLKDYLEGTTGGSVELLDGFPIHGVSRWLWKVTI